MDRARAYERDPWYHAQAEAALRALDAPPGPLLDVGCGTGWLLRHGPRPGVGVDRCEARLAVARELAAAEGRTDLSFVRADWEREHVDLPPAAAAFCVSTLHYFQDPAAAAARMRAALAPGGQLLLLEREMDGAVLNRAWNFVHRFVLRDGIRFRGTRWMTRMLEAAGFSDVRVAARIRRGPWKGRMQSNLVLLVARAAGGSA